MIRPKYADVIIALGWAMLAVTLLAMAGCGVPWRSEPPQPDGGGTAAWTLQSLGSLLVWVGGISAAAGIACRVLAMVYPAFAPLAAISGAAGIGGACVLACGSSIQFLADNPWLMVSCIVAAVAATVWWYWPRIYRLLLRRMDAQVKAKGNG